jgi:hypothetical protein
MRFNALTSASGPTRTRRPFASSISMRLSALVASLAPRSVPLLAGTTTETGRNAGAAAGFASFWASFRQRNRRLGLIPNRRATAGTFTPGCKASPMIACFSSSLQRRRVSATTEYRCAKLSPDIGTGIAPVVTSITNKTCILAPPQGGLHRRITFKLCREALEGTPEGLDTRELALRPLHQGKRHGRGLQGHTECGVQAACETADLTREARSNCRGWKA